MFWTRYLLTENELSSLLDKDIVQNQIGNKIHKLFHKFIKTAVKHIKLWNGKTSFWNNLMNITHRLCSLHLTINFEANDVTLFYPRKFFIRTPPPPVYKRMNLSLIAEKSKIKIFFIAFFIFLFRQNSYFFCVICWCYFSPQFWNGIFYVSLLSKPPFLLTLTCVDKDDSPLDGFNKYPGPPQTRDNRETGVKIQDINPNQENIFFLFRTPGRFLYFIFSFRKMTEFLMRKICILFPIKRTTTKSK